MATRRPDDDGLGGLNHRQRATAATHLAFSLLAGVLAMAACLPLLPAPVAGLVGWTVAALVFLVWTWTALWPLDAALTARLAQREDPGRVLRDVVLIGVGVGTTLTVALVVFRVQDSGPALTALGAGSIAVSWAVMNTVLTLRYARLYYGGQVGGLGFAGEQPPNYRDFAYVAFTVGMTFQVSDTQVESREIRATVLRHALLAFVFNTVIIAVTINVVAGLSR